MLSAEQLSEIVAAYADAKAQHKRRCARVRHSAKTAIYRKAATPADAALAVQICDVSARGFSFTVKEAMARGSQFVIRFSRRDQPPLAMLCTAMHCRAYGNGFRVGAEFTCPLDVKRDARAAETSKVDLERIRGSILG